MLLNLSLIFFSINN